ncbi:hypothetical protein BJY00DRAFT_310375 [Aspergillus carlsbadensis]|nr:hypothetical protein BJY00DRAFT_310375 [Aspergillus carlsbadensis]
MPAHSVGDVPVQRSDDATPDPKIPNQKTARAAPDEREITPANWGVGWQCPVMMVGPVICGALLAVGHHLYYDSLDDTRVTSINQQTWAIRIGTGFAFLIRSFLVSAVGVAAVQELWSTLRKKSIRLYGIDSMFAVMGSPIALLTWDVWVYAKTLTLLAIVAWLIPLTAIVTPATLSVRLLTTLNTTQLHVPTVDFGAQSFWYDWVTFGGAGYISAASPSISRLFAATTSAINMLTVHAPFPNSSYTLDFWGPSYKCESLSDAIVEMQGITFTQEFGDNYTSLQALWDAETNTTYRQMELYTGAAPVLLNNALFIRTTGQNPLWQPPSETGQSTTELVCRLYNTSYTVNLNFTDGTQSLTPLSVSPLNPANWTSTEGQDSSIPSNIRLEAESPYTPNSGFHITYLLFRGLLERRLSAGASGNLAQESDSNGYGDGLSITQSGLFSCPEIWNSTIYGNLSQSSIPVVSQCRNGTLAAAIEDLSHNFTYSLLSLNAANTSLPVFASSLQNFYTYDYRNLAAVYAAAVGVTVACVAVGFLALARNGVPQNTAFSSLLLTTRNPELDSLGAGNCLGGGVLDKDVGSVRLRFGEVVAPEGEGCTATGSSGRRHAAFGTQGAVAGIVKGEKYY